MHLRSPHPEDICIYQRGSHLKPRHASPDHPDGWYRIRMIVRKVRNVAIFLMPSSLSSGKDRVTALDQEGKAIWHDEFQTSQKVLYTRKLMEASIVTGLP